MAGRRCDQALASTGPGSFPVTPTSRPRPPVCSTLYARRWEGQLLGPDDYVISADEKSQLQALQTPPPRTTAATRANPPGRVRVPPAGGTLAYFAAYDVHRARVLGRIAPKTRHRAVHRPGRRSHDNRALRLGPAGVLGRRQRLVAQWGTLHRPHADHVADRDPGTPTDTRILAQPGRDLLLDPAAKSHQPPTTSPTINQLSQRILGFQDRFNATAAPFDWDLHPRRPQRLPAPASTSTTPTQREHTRMTPR